MSCAHAKTRVLGRSYATLQPAPYTGVMHQNMKIEQSKIVRAKFVGCLLAILLLVLLLSALVQPSSLLYTIGVVIPGLYLLVLCFRGNQKSFSGLVRLNVARLIYLGCLFTGLVIHYYISSDFAIGWYVSVFIFMFYEPIVFNFFVMLNLIPPANTESGYK